MYSKICILAIASILTMILHSASINFASAASECFGESLDQFLCIGTDTLSNGQVISWVYECIKDKDGKWDCHDLKRVNTMPSDLKAEIDASIKEEVQNNISDSKEIGGMKSDKGLSKSPIN